MMHKPIYSSETEFLRRKKEKKVLKSFSSTY